LYVTRPDVPVPTVPGVMPRMFEGGIANKDRFGALEQADASGADSRREASTAGRPTRARAGLTPGAGKPAAPMEAAFDAAPGSPPVTSEDLAAYAARTQAAAMEVGEVFQYQLESPVTVERQRSAMLPILSAGIEGRRVSIYNPADGSSHPMRGVEIVNTSKLQLMPGPISVYDSGAYAGDAQVGHVPAGDKRLLAYSVDLETDVTTSSTNGEEVRKVRFVKGTLELSVLMRATTEYGFTNKDIARGRLLIVEHPRRDGWTLKQPAKPSEQTAQTYRFELGIDAGKTEPLKIVEEWETFRQYHFTQFTGDAMLVYSKSGAASEAVVNAFREIGRRQAEIAGHQKTIDDLNAERGRIGEDQNRIRSNMGSIDRNSDLYRRYMTKFAEQESRLEAITTEAEAAQQKRDQAQAGLDEFVANLSVD
jgi:hypothetical protein